MLFFSGDDKPQPWKDPVIPDESGFGHGHHVRRCTLHIAAYCNNKIIISSVIINHCPS